MVKPFPGTCSYFPHRFDFYHCIYASTEELIHPDQPNTTGNLILRNEAAVILKECGISNKGFLLLTTALTITAKNPNELNNLKKGLYPKVAREHQTTATRVERNIRSAIEKAWTTCDPAILNFYFGNTIDPHKGKPTNLQFLVILTEVIQRRCNYPCVPL